MSLIKNTVEHFLAYFGEELTKNVEASSDMAKQSAEAAATHHVTGATLQRILDVLPKILENYQKSNAFEELSNTSAPAADTTGDTHDATL